MIWIARLVNKELETGKAAKMSFDQLGVGDIMYTQQFVKLEKHPPLLSNVQRLLNRVDFFKDNVDIYSGSLSRLYN